MAAAGLSLLAAAALVSRAGAQDRKPAAPKSQTQKPAEPTKGVKAQVGDTVITAGEIDYNTEKRQYIFTVDVDLVSKTTHMTSDRMTVQLDDQNQMQWAKCDGNVTIDKKDPDGTMMTGRGRTMEYYDVEQKANLQGNVTVTQSSERLAKPAVITGSRVDMDLKTKKNVVYRSPDTQAKAHIEPKGKEGDPTPEPADLVGDRIDQDGQNNEYVATGKPFFVRPSSRLQAKTIRFSVDQKTNDIDVAYAEENVIYDGQSEKGSVVHCTGDHGEFHKDQNLMTMDGSPDGGGTVHATVKDPGDEKPTIYQGVKFIYNTETGYRKLVGKPASIILPDKPKKQGPAAAPASPDGQKPDGQKPGAPGNEKGK